MDPRRLGRTDLLLSPIGLGAFKIGRNEGIKYPKGYDLPTDIAVRDLVDGALSMGINYIDTAPAYGTSEKRLGQVLPPPSRVVVSTKVGETFFDGVSSYDFSSSFIRRSVEQSRRDLRREVIDILFIHSDGRDLWIQNDTDAIKTLRSLKDEGVVRAIGFSGKSVEGAEAALLWADALMVVYNPDDRSHEDVIRRAAARGVGVVVKKALGSGTLDPTTALQFVLDNDGVTSVVVGSLSLKNMRANVAVADEL